MPHIGLAAPGDVRPIYRESHRLWGAGLTLEDYRGLWGEVSRTEWAARHVRFLVWRDDDSRVLSSMKVYRPIVRLGRSVARWSVLGAIYTPSAHRLRGHASAFVRAVVDQARARGDPAAMLFTDIGTGFYSRLGFRPLPCEEYWGLLPSTGAPGGTDWELRPATASDLPEIRDAHRASSDSLPFAIVRDEDHWRYLRVRTSSFLRRLRDSAIRDDFDVALREGSVAGYLVGLRGRGEWNLREVGAADGSPRTMARIVRLGALRAARSGMHRFYGWIQEDVVANLSAWPLGNCSRGRAVPMVIPLAAGVDLRPLDSMGSAFLPYLDQF